jgi:hypothetical protein
MSQPIPIRLDFATEQGVLMKSLFSLIRIFSSIALLIANTAFAVRPTQGIPDDVANFHNGIQAASSTVSKIEDEGLASDILLGGEVAPKAHTLRYVFKTVAGVSLPPFRFQTAPNLMKGRKI